MYRKLSHVLLKRTNPSTSFSRRKFSLNNFVDVSPEVSEALKTHRPVVILESTIITHGMPYPENVSTAIRVEQIIRNQGAIPATVAIVAGRVKVGLDILTLQELGEMKTPAVKTSRRDFPYVLSNKLNGGTTVSGTIIIANLVGVPIFVTGGIGGVHRDGQFSLDISADLNELGKNPVMVISSGVKSILDIGRTLEYLETQGVCVASYGPTKRFPAFYTRDSGFDAPYNVTLPSEAAALINSLHELKLSSGILLAVPIPEEHAIGGEKGSIKLNEAINAAIKDAEKNGISGKKVTPYLLSKLNKLTEGRSLEANIALIENNAKVGGQVAVELSALRENKSPRVTVCSSESCKVSPPLSPVVIGGSVLDCVISVSEKNIQLDGRTHQGQISQSGGGVGRNMADALGKLGASPLLLTAVGRDQFGSFLVDHTLGHLESSGLRVVDTARTACYNVVLDGEGECRLGVGDMAIHNHISPDYVSKFANKLLESPLVVIDGNIPTETINYVIELCKKAGVPVWFEPTDIKKASKPFQSGRWKNLKFVSPNFNELKMMSKAAGLPVNMELTTAGSHVETLLEECAALGTRLVAQGNGTTVIVTLGSLGVMVVQRGLANEPFYIDRKLISHKQVEVTARFYPVKRETSVVNVSGAGDCFASGFILAMLQGKTETECISCGLAASLQALRSVSAVPNKLTAMNGSPVPYKNML